MSSTSAGQRPLSTLAGRLSLISLVAACALFELVLYRICLPALRTIPLAALGPSWVLRALETCARFGHNLAAVLAVLLLALGLGLAVTRLARGLSGRLALGLVAAMQVPLSALVVVAPGWLAEHQLVGRVQLLLQIGCVTLAVLIGLLVLPMAAPRRLKAGVLALLAPLVIHFEVCWRMAVGQAEGPGELDRWGQVLAVVAAGLAPLLLPPGPQRGRGGAVKLAWATGAALGLMGAAVIALDWDFAARLMYHVLGLDLPTLRVAQGAYLLGLGLFGYAVTWLLLQDGPLRLRGFGLLLIGLAGYDVRDGYLLALPLLGLLCIVRSAAEEDLSP